MLLKHLKMTKAQRSGFVGTILGTLGATLFKNMFAGESVTKIGEGSSRAAKKKLIPSHLTKTN